VARPFAPGLRQRAGGWNGTALRAARRYLTDGMADRAPTLAYYGILSLFPFLLIAFALVRLVGGSDAPDDLARYSSERGWSDALAESLRSVAETARTASATSAGSLGAAGIATLVYGASRAFTALGRALDVMHRRPSTARSIGRRAADIAWTLVLIVLTITALGLVAIGGRLLEDLLDLVGIEPGAIPLWMAVRWLVAALLMLLIVAIVRWASPTERRPFRLFTPGIVGTVVALGLGSVGFDVYVSQIASYNTTYGTFAGGIILLLWIWLASVALLMGGELDAVLEERVNGDGGDASPRASRPAAPAAPPP
jgi:membrane protein